MPWEHCWTPRLSVVPCEIQVVTVAALQGAVAKIKGINLRSASWVPGADLVSQDAAVEEVAASLPPGGTST